MSKPKEKATKQNFNLPDKYEFKRQIGSGAYGLVCACVNKKTGEEVAVKKVPKVFDRKILTKRTLREIKMLRHFQGHENITCVLDIFKLGVKNDNFEDIYLVQELMEADMHQIIRSRQKLSNAHYQYFIYQILRALKYIHSANVIHRDLKPGNLLVNADCELKICDFGLARGTDENIDNFLTEYVATRWYRAPEIMLSFSNYTKAIDIWSVGCIFAELLQGKVLFPGRDYINQMTLIINVLGTPSPETLNRIGNERAQEWVRSMGFKPKQSFTKMFPDADAPAIDLLEKMLDFDPTTRITVEEALQHPYLESYHDPSDEPSHVPLDFSFEMLDSIEELKKVIMEEINSYPFTARTSLVRKGSKSLAKAPVKKRNEDVDEIDQSLGQMDVEDADSSLEAELAKREKNK